LKINNKNIKLQCEGRYHTQYFEEIQEGKPQKREFLNKKTKDI